MSLCRITNVLFSFEINYDLVVSFNSALMTFSLEIDGKSWGSVEPKFE